MVASSRSAVIKIKCINELSLTLAVFCERQWKNMGFEADGWILVNVNATGM